MSNEYIEEPEERARKTKERTISFRVDEARYQSIENMAEVRGKKPSEWVRELVESEASKDIPMTVGERLVFEEMARLRFIIGKAVRLLAGEELTLEAWYQVLAEADQSSEKIGEELLSKRRSLTTRAVQMERKGARA